MNDITIVTAFFDIDRDKWKVFPRDINEYFEYFERMCKLHNQIIVFTELKFKEKIEEIKNRTKKDLIIFYEDIFERNQNLLDRISKVQNSEQFKNGLTVPFCPEYWEPRYVLVNFLKSYFVCQAIDRVKNISDTVAWIDFGYLRTEEALPDNLNWQYNFTDKIHLLYRKPITDNISIVNAIKTNDVYIFGSPIISNKRKWKKFNGYMNFIMETVLNNNLIDDDQGLHLICYLTYRDDFELHYVEPGSLGPFVVFRMFQ